MSLRGRPIRGGTAPRDAPRRNHGFGGAERWRAGPALTLLRIKDGKQPSDQLLRIEAFVKERDRAALNDFGLVTFPLQHGQGDDHGFRCARPQSGKRIKAIDLRHCEVKKDQVGLESGGGNDGLVPIAGFAHDDEAAGALEYGLR